MKETNYSHEIYEKIKEEDRGKYDLYVDAIYKADPKKPDLSAEVLSKLLNVKNQGGFRYKGTTESPKLVVLFSSGEDVYWRDELDSSSGVLLYYGDNKKPGTDLHETKLHGNEILRYVFDLAASTDINERKKLPVILVFKKANDTRDVKFLGLAVPGIKGKPQKDWLTAAWGSNENGDRFQNYKSYFTILDTSSGSSFRKGQGINLKWLSDIEVGRAYESAYAPYEWKKYIEMKNYKPLIAKGEKFIKSKEEQLPYDTVKMKMLKELHDYFIQKDNGYSFEKFAADLIQHMDTNIIDVNVTRPYKDGGFDASGRYKIFDNADNLVYADFYLQAKCYQLSNGVATRDTSRLISRIKNRQFGIMFTTSYVANQAYEEILTDGHPIVIINGKNIIDYLFDEFELKTLEKLIQWLESNYPYNK